MPRCSHTRADASTGWTDALLAMAAVRPVQTVFWMTALSVLPDSNNTGKSGRKGLVLPDSIHL